MSARFALAAVLCATLAACAGKPRVDNKPPERPIMKPDPQGAATYNVELGVAYMERGELAVAQDKLERALKEAPRDPEVHSALALLEERLGNPAGADHEFREAIRLAPQRPDFVNNYAVYLCRTHRVDEGVKQLLATARNPLYSTPEAAYTNAAVCLRSEHRDAEAKRALESAVALRPGFAEAVFQLADLEVQQGELADAQARINHYIETYTATPDLLLLGVRVSKALHDPFGQQRYEQRLRVDFPNSPQTQALASSNQHAG
ncbi:MAG TPA: type IV pilus biogenesis/stability protein PilW [Steroidobacteraceae bacterium]|jgi:type IV pilus assembly protein PilF